MAFILKSVFKAPLNRPTPAIGDIDKDGLFDIIGDKLRKQEICQ